MCTDQSERTQASLSTNQERRQSFPALGTRYIFSRAWHWLHIFPRIGTGYVTPILAPVIRFPALGARDTFSRAYWSRFPTFPPRSLLVPVLPALGTSCTYPSKVVYACDKFLFLSLFSSLRENMILIYTVFFFLLRFSWFYLTARATVAKIRQATPTGLENKVLLLLSSNILRFLAVQYAKANTIPKSAI